MYDMAAYVKKGDPTDRLISATDVGKNYLQLNFWDYLFVKKGDPLFPVSSAFGGMAIYKIKSFKEVGMTDEPANMFLCIMSCLKKDMVSFILIRVLFS